MPRPRKIRDASETFSLAHIETPGPGIDRVALLEKIEEHGSISKAARAVGVSYKTAWDTVDALNNLFSPPLVERLAGGRGGGGTALTENGRSMLAKYRVIREEHRKFVASIRGRIGEIGPLHPLMRRISMKVSARNVFAGRVKALKRGAVNAEVVLELGGGKEIVSVVTNGAVENLGLREGMDAYAIVKASSIVLGRELRDGAVSARNVLRGTIEKLTEGPVSADVTVGIGGGNTVSAIITEESLRAMELKVGDEVAAIFKASAVILGIDG